MPTLEKRKRAYASMRQNVKTVELEEYLKSDTSIELFHAHTLCYEPGSVFEPDAALPTICGGYYVERSRLWPQSIAKISASMKVYYVMRMYGFSTYHPF